MSIAIDLPDALVDALVERVLERLASKPASWRDLRGAAEVYGVPEGVLPEQLCTSTTSRFFLGALNLEPNGSYA